MKKRGMSPIIATILLIAFAVALGAVVMNLGRSGGGGSECGVFLDFEIVKKDGKPKACLNNNGGNSHIEVLLQNGVNADIEDIHISVIGEKNVFNKDNLLKEKLEKSDAKKVLVLYDAILYGNVEQVIITPLIQNDKELVMCKSSRIKLDELNNCQG
ncbi:MAG: hypothetical protein MAG795_00641 [Candidatus Woesearchaeota archaeon]|nr:hypothetical protein [Candidatus Woesearchaeota archaeon]